MVSIDAVILVWWKMKTIVERAVMFVRVAKLAKVEGASVHLERCFATGSVSPKTTTTVEVAVTFVRVEKRAKVVNVNVLLASFPSRDNVVETLMQRLALRMEILVPLSKHASKVGAGTR